MFIGMIIGMLTGTKSQKALWRPLSSTARPFCHHFLSHLLLILVTSLTVGCKQLGQTTHQNQMVNSSNDKVPMTSALFGEWPQQQFPLELKISEEFSSSEREAIILMADSWEEGGQHQIDFFDGLFPTTSNPQHLDAEGYLDGEMGIYKAPNWFPQVGRQALAITQFSGRRRNVGSEFEYIELEHADILINTRDYKFSTSAPPLPGHYDLATVVLHEMGHFLGLPHESTTLNSIMNPALSSSSQHRHLWPIDSENIRKNYQINPFHEAEVPMALLSRGLKLRPRDFEQENNGSERDLHPKEGEFVQGFIELHSDGTCRSHITGTSKSQGPQRP